MSLTTQNINKLFKLFWKEDINLPIHERINKRGDREWLRKAHKNLEVQERKHSKLILNLLS